MHCLFVSLIACACASAETIFPPFGNARGNARSPRIGAIGPDWVTVNDDVMGGVSGGLVYVADDGALVFEGDVSFDNNGGFAGASAPSPVTDLSNFAGIKVTFTGKPEIGEKKAMLLDLTGAGLAFNFGGSSGGTGSFVINPDETEQTAFVPFSTLSGTRFTTPVASNLNLANLRRLGFSMSFQDGPFYLRAESLEATNECAPDSWPLANPVSSPDMAVSAASEALKAADSIASKSDYTGAGPLRPTDPMVLLRVAAAQILASEGDASLAGAQKEILDAVDTPITVKGLTQNLEDALTAIVNGEGSEATNGAVDAADLKATLDAMFCAIEQS